jgi:acetylornithine deacetylase/succinyl-diaminopimelate desuccinylase-like protein
MSRDKAISSATTYFDGGGFLHGLREKIAQRTESQASEANRLLEAYLRDTIIPEVAALGFTSRLLDNPDDRHGPFLVAERVENGDLPTVLIYGHGDTVPGDAGRWRVGLDPWQVTVEGDRWFGRGTADNKGQHAINLAALAHVMTARGGRLGFNVKILIEMGEEVGSPGLRTLCIEQADLLAADLLVASDGPRLTAERPTIFLGSRGNFNFELDADLREKAYHSGNWGGLLRNPGTVLAAAIACLVDGSGRILVPGLRPPPIPDNVRRALADVRVGGGSTDPEIDQGWGEPGLSPEERVFAWNTLEVLAFRTGDPDHPINAVPPRAIATLQLRFVVGTDWQHIPYFVRAHLDQHGFSMVQVRPSRAEAFPATRLDLDDPWVHWAANSIAQTTGKRPALLPNFGGSLPNDVFSEILGLPTLWIPHSYPACGQHAPDEHLLGSIAREGLALMAGLFWDLGEPEANICAQETRSRRENTRPQ